MNLSEKPFSLGNYFKCGDGNGKRESRSSIGIQISDGSTHLYTLEGDSPKNFKETAYSSKKTP